MIQKIAPKYQRFSTLAPAWAPHVRLSQPTAPVPEDIFSKGGFCGLVRRGHLPRMPVSEPNAVRHSAQTVTVTRKKVAGIDVASLFALLFWLLNSASSSFCSSSAR